MTDQLGMMMSIRFWLLFLVTLVLNFEVRALDLNDMSELNQEREEADIIFKDFCKKNDITYSFIDGSDLLNATQSERDIITAHRICRESLGSLNDATNLCKQETDESSCQYILSLRGDLTAKSYVTKSSVINGNASFPKLTQCEEAANSIIGICKKKDQSLESTLMSITKQSASMIANTSAKVAYASI